MDGNPLEPLEVSGVAPHGLVAPLALVGEPLAKGGGVAPPATPQSSLPHSGPSAAPSLEVVPKGAEGLDLPHSGSSEAPSLEVVPKGAEGVASPMLVEMHSFMKSLSSAQEAKIKWMEELP